MSLNVNRTFLTNASRSWIGVISVAAGILAWHLITRYSGIPNFILPSPLSVWTRFLKALGDGSLLYHTGITLIEVLMGLV
ncbi:MAG TPA: hypothetical protein VGK56_10010, partial [Anaerolineales bacterium]